MSLDGIPGTCQGKPNIINLNCEIFSYIIELPNNIVVESNFDFYSSFLKRQKVYLVLQETDVLQNTVEITKMFLPYLASHAVDSLVYSS